MIARAALLLLLLVPRTAWAGALEDAEAAYAKKDYSTALRLFRPLAEQGNANAQYNLGNMYGWGNGVPRNYPEAVQWFRLAAEQGHATAQYNLGVMYDQGKGVPENRAEAVKWYRLAAEQGDAAAQYGLGLMYELGQGVPQNYVYAHMWLNIGAARNEDATQRKMSAEARDRVARLMTPAQIAEAQRLASESKPKPEKH